MKHFIAAVILGLSMHAHAATNMESINKDSVCLITMNGEGGLPISIAAHLVQRVDVVAKFDPKYQVTTYSTGITYATSGMFVRDTSYSDRSTKEQALVIFKDVQSQLQACVKRKD